MSAYSADTLGQAALDSGDLEYFVKSEIVPADFPIQLNVAALGVFVPALEDMFADKDDTPCDLYCRATGAPFGNFSDADGLTGTFAGECSIYVRNQTSGEASTENDFFAVTLGATEIDFKLIAEVNGGKIYGNVTKIVFGNMTVRDNHVGGEVDLEQIRDFFNSLAELALPALNQALAKGFDLPVFAGVDLTDSQLINHAGFIKVGSNPKISTSEFGYSPNEEGIRYFAHRIVSEWAYSFLTLDLSNLFSLVDYKAIIDYILDLLDGLFN